MDSALEAKLLDEFHGRCSVKLRTQVSAAKLTNFSIGGPFQFFLEPENLAELSQAVRALRSLGQSYRVIGAGSNLLVDSDGLPGWTIKLGRGFRFVEELGQGSFAVGASYGLMPLARELSEKGFSGLEFAGGIPASLGGALRMNAGAYGGQIGDIVGAVRGVDGSGAEAVIPVSALNFSYRSSSIPADFIVTAVELRLVKGEPNSVMALRAKYLEERKAKQPLTLPCAGSVFRNPPGEKSAGYLIEQCGLKGTSIGGAQISRQHANWIVNPERSASAKDVVELVSLCQEQVRLQFQIDLKLEIVLWPSNLTDK